MGKGSGKLPSHSGEKEENQLLLDIFPKGEDDSCPKAKKPAGKIAKQEAEKGKKREEIDLFEQHKQPVDTRLWKVEKWGIVGVFRTSKGEVFHVFNRFSTRLGKNIKSSVP